MNALIALALLLAAPEPEPANGATVLCCHQHDDGSVGCWPAAASNVDCEMTYQCPGGASQGSADDEESWSCDPPRLS